MSKFRTSLGEDIFRQKYAQNAYQTWEDKAHTIVNWVCGDMNGTKNNLIGKDERDHLTHYISEFKFMPGGRYLWYAGRKARFFNNCYLLKAEEDSREEWAALWQRGASCLMTGGGIGCDVSAFRPKGRTLSKTGGVSSGPIPFLLGMNEIGRNVMQGGSRRSAMYGSLSWEHEDAADFLTVKNWSPELRAAKEADFNTHAPLDMTNISLNYSDSWLSNMDSEIFHKNVYQAMSTGEPGFSFNFGPQANETLRNACCEVVSEDDSDVCNLGSVNMANIENFDEFKEVVELASKFLVCGLIRAELPYGKVEKVRQRNSRLGLGLMGMHEWLLQRGYRYEMTDELTKWLAAYARVSEKAANEHCDRLYLSRPKGYRAIAPTGSISMLAGTTSGIEPVYSVAYKRRYLTDGTKWKAQFAIDSTAETLIASGILPEKIETAIDLAADPERRIKFQSDVQRYVDMAISSTVNLPAWGSELNNESTVPKYAAIIQRHAKGLRGLTVYPDGSRGGQPITSVPYEEAKSKRGVVFDDNSDMACKDGVCGI